MHHESAHDLIGEVLGADGGINSWQEQNAILEITERICQLMAENGVSRAELAKRLNKSKSYITQLLDGSRNMTVRTITDAYLALGYAFHPSDIRISEANPLGENIKPKLANDFTYAGDVAVEKIEESDHLIPFSVTRRASAYSMTEKVG